MGDRFLILAIRIDRSNYAAVMDDRF